ncbi:hypothetical protein EMIHUDRAFT_456096 [Emiliania huxleyi CCMP1516]|uniref:Glutaredoxin domain-containing protein n=2 Tax=Emiliania huxleyi TaxID=2903 RepID=A0A0D3K9E7_EMIH1|nr:hypothetical protein EMIHUDRAFT_456096 [Emiliania huxleyi CCMP1516]EOD32382.1 hypothetical protein EMIHUDRAFT_456096 [Emiliania huxleyi CCMP1516]|eukprot:XP_005784811.1 hypothetical protein EMIHUDRAFT_456096 [Emiliania huxleyi CCMP1516]
MLALALQPSALVVGGTPPAVVQAPRASPPVMMPKFLKDAFPNLEKPDDAIASVQEAWSDFVGKIVPAGAEPPVIEVREPTAAISAAGKAMPLLGPVFSVEADLQAALTNFGSYDPEEVRAEIASTLSSAPVVVYTYGLSPFSSEVVAILESTGCQFKNVELGAEWFALGGKGSATRVELRKLYGQGSLPHVFIGGEWARAL